MNVQIRRSRTRREGNESGALLSRLAAISFSLVATLASQSAGAEDFDRWGDTAHYEFEYRVELGSMESGDGQRGRVWLPMPADPRDQ
ncbi:MAG: hypothetical protein JRJ05_13800, partial [Deltaproteobacteria bacterium]|nr:hypothetical protein [Deltaproteobacteria bacterium]